MLEQLLAGSVTLQVLFIQKMVRGALSRQRYKRMRVARLQIVRILRACIQQRRMKRKVEAANLIKRAIRRKLFKHHLISELNRRITARR